MRAVCSPPTPAAIFLCLFPFKTTRVVTCRNGDKIEKKEAKMELDMSSDSDSDLDEQEDDPDEEIKRIKKELQEVKDQRKKLQKA